MRCIGNCEFLSKIILNDHTNENSPNAGESMYAAGLYHMYRPEIIQSEERSDEPMRERV